MRRSGWFSTCSAAFLSVATNMGCDAPDPAPPAAFAAGGSNGDSGDDTRGSGASGGAGDQPAIGGSGGGEQPACTLLSDCPATDSPCAKVTCTDGVCGFEYAPWGTEMPLQAPADCRKSICDGEGVVTSIADDADLPVDGNDCTEDLCDVGVASNPPIAAGTACMAGLCNALGQCVGCLSPGDCSGEDVFCHTRTCVAGVCGFTDEPAGTSLPLSDQTFGDCQLLACDGHGHVAPQGDDADVPVDGNDCTKNVCNMGLPSNPDEPVGAACASSNVCDGTGSCVPCVTDDHCGGSFERCMDDACVVAANWTKVFEASERQVLAGMVVDDDGNTLLAGFFRGTIDFGGAALLTGTTCCEVVNGFVVKLDGAGNHLWSRQTSGDFVNDYQAPTAIATNATGNVAVVGEFDHTLEMGTVGLSTYAGAPNPFVMKLGANGTPVWAKRVDSYGALALRAVALDAAGAITVAGTLEGFSNFGTGARYPESDADVVLARYDAAGNVLWVRQLGAPGSIQEVDALAIDPAGDMFLTGRGASYDLGPPSAPGTGSFLAKLDATGQLLWVQPTAGTALGIDGSTHAITTNADAVLRSTIAEKHAATGEQLWSNVASSGGLEWGAPTFDASGNVLIAAKSSHIDVGAGLMQSGASDFLLLRLTASGDVAHASFAGKARISYGVGIGSRLRVGVQPSGRMIVAGAFWDELDLGAGAFAATQNEDAIFVTAFTP